MLLWTDCKRLDEELKFPNYGKQNEKQCLPLHLEVMVLVFLIISKQSGFMKDDSNEMES